MNNLITEVNAAAEDDTVEPMIIQDEEEEKKVEEPKVIITDDNDQQNKSAEEANVTDQIKAKQIEKMLVANSRSMTNIRDRPASSEAAAADNDK